jgi:hypothetical protein
MKKLIACIIIMTSIATFGINISSNQNPKSSWFWQDFTLVDYKSIINQASNSGISQIYLNLEHQLYIDKNPTFHIKSIIDYTKILSSLISYAKQLNIKIHGMLGGNEFSLKNNSNLILQTLNYIESYNRSNQDKISGFHIDFEYYTHPSFENNKIPLTIQYLETNTLIANWLKVVRLTSPKFEFSQALPFALFDNQIFPRVLHNNQDLFFLAHINNILGDSSLNYIVIMAYRNTAIGLNSIIEISRPIEEYLFNSKSKLGFEIAIETAKINPENTSFYNKSNLYLFTQLTYVDWFYKSKPNYRGLAIHDLHSLILRNK